MTTLLALILFGIISTAGYLVCRCVAREDRLFIAIPAGVVLGINFFVAGLNVAGNFFLLAPAAWGTALILGAAASCLRRYKIPPPLIAAGNVSSLVAVLAIMAALSIGYGVILSGNPDLLYDRHVHGPLIATMANGNFPAHRPDAPTVPLNYHYGADLYAAGFSAATGLPAWQAEIIVIIINLTAAGALIYALGRAFGGNAWTGWSATALFFLGGSFANFSHLNSARLFDVISQITPGYGIQLLHSPTAMAAPLSFLILYLATRLTKHSNPIGVSSILGVMLGTLALMAEDRVGILFVTLLLVAGVGWYRHRKNSPIPTLLWQYLPAIVIAAALMALQGGVITDALRQVGAGGTPWLATATPAAPSFPFWDDLPPYSGRLPITSPRALPFALREFALGVIGLVGITWMYRRKKIAGSAWPWLLAAAWLSFLLPPVLQFGVSDLHRARLYATFRDFSNFSAGILLGIALAAAMQKKSAGRRRFAAIILVAITVFFSGGQMIYITRELTASSNRIIQNRIPSWLRPEEQLAATIGRNLPPGSIVLTNDPIIVGRLWGQLTAYMDPYTYDTFNPVNYLNEDYASLLQHPSREGLLRLGITHIYVTPVKGNQTWNETYQQPMATRPYEESPEFTLLYQHRGDDGERRIYAFQPKMKYPAAASSGIFDGGKIK